MYYEDCGNKRIVVVVVVVVFVVVHYLHKVWQVAVTHLVLILEAGFLIDCEG